MIDPLALGGTLYIPATRPDLARSIQRVPDLRSCVICLEDAIPVHEAPAGLRRIAELLSAPLPSRALIFVRPRDPAMLAHLLRLPGAGRLAGFVLPKVTPTNLADWMDQPLAPRHVVMPTLETREVFDPDQLRTLRDQLLVVRDRVLAVRIGGNDLLQCLGLRRPSTRSIYDGPLGAFISTIAGTFLPHGFALSGPVMERYDDPLLLRAEFARDLEHGLTSKSAIHPAQLPVIHGGLAVAAADLAEAHAILAPAAPAVFGVGGRMCEPATHRRWAETIVRRADLYGVADPLPIALQA